MKREGRFGIACHIGLLTDIPSFGCAKNTALWGCRYTRKHRGEYSLIEDRGETIRAMVRTKDNVKPLIVSIGHRISLKTSIQFVMNCCRNPYMSAEVVASVNIDFNLRRHPVQSFVYPEDSKQLSLAASMAEYVGSIAPGAWHEQPHTLTCASQGWPPIPLSASALE